MKNSALVRSSVFVGRCYITRFFSSYSLVRAPAYTRSPQTH